MKAADSAINQAVQQGGASSEVSASLSSQASLLLVGIENRIASFEKQYSSSSGFLIGLSSASVLAFSCVASQVYMPGMPLIEVLFIVFLFGFLLNYFSIRQAEINPYIENEAQNFLAKVCGISAFLSIICLIYAYEKSQDIPTTLYFFGIAWVIQTMFEQSHYRTARSIIISIILLSLSYVILQPNMLPEIHLVQTRIVNAENAPHLIGTLAALIAGGLFGYSNQSLRQLGQSKQRVVLVVHVFMYFQAPFFPCFFAMQKLLSPTLPHWIFMIALSGLAVLTVHFYVRATQLEQSSASLQIIPLFVAVTMIFSMLLGVTTFGVPTAMKVLASILTILIVYAASLRTIPENSNLHSENNTLKQELIQMDDLTHKDHEQ